MSNEEARMTFTEHLGELRTRIIRAAVSVVVALVICFTFSDQIFDLVARPFDAVIPPQEPQHQSPGETTTGTATTASNPAESSRPVGRWQALSPFEGILVKLRLAGYASIILSLPFILYQLCAFVFPGLTRGERRLMQVLICGCAAFAVLGVMVAYFAVLPIALPSVMRWLPARVAFEPRMNETVTQILLVLLGFAVAFQFPMVAMSLTWLGLITPATLKRFRRLAIVVMAVAAAMFTPPDPVSMILMLVPMILLYELSIWICYMIVRRKRQAEPSG